MAFNCNTPHLPPIARCHCTAPCLLVHFSAWRCGWKHDIPDGSRPSHCVASPGSHAVH
jgi:hypothetical protein